MMRAARGMALVETMLLGLVLIVPLLWLLGFLDHMHRAALGATTAAREAGFATAAAVDPASRSGAEEAVSLALEGHGLDVDRADLRLRVPNGGRRGGLVRVQVRYLVPMIGLPGLDSFGLWVSARHDAAIDTYRSR